jgi:hypothetical protein
MTRRRTRIRRDRASAPSHSHDSSGNDAPSLIPNPATPAKAGAHGKSGSRPPVPCQGQASPGKRGGDVELVVSTKWRDSGCLFLVAPAKAGAQATGAVPAARDARFRGHDGEVGECRTLEADD